MDTHTRTYRHYIDLTIHGDLLFRLVTATLNETADCQLIILNFLHPARLDCDAGALSHGSTELYGPRERPCLPQPGHPRLVMYQHLRVSFWRRHEVFGDQVLIDL
jgi:hypothetical protein